ncbi:TetR/AcrR family transcriptional regulator [Niveispirillum irakense]|uniref:TetR/AcrR family transcriptional regulator n=1 Tax=Niveispirillum irakense TaxID=34011 RepID=UPI0004222208|nr:TetR/AcrR family transcriptional regulator [Niveispirillum irakense]
MARLVAERADAIPLLAEAFREFGFEGASISRLCKRTGLGKGSLYHFFPGGKEEMAAAVLESVQHWFAGTIFQPLETLPPAEAVNGMIDAVADYFQSGRRICLVGAFALDGTRDRFAPALNGYFTQWHKALAIALQRAGLPPAEAESASLDTLVTIQGALVLSRALDSEQPFRAAMEQVRQRLSVAWRGP